MTTQSYRKIIVQCFNQIQGLDFSTFLVGLDQIGKYSRSGYKSWSQGCLKAALHTESETALRTFRRARNNFVCYKAGVLPPSEESLKMILSLLSEATKPSTTTVE